jgi:uncharacterized damage-inducible protein DinB
MSAFAHQAQSLFLRELNALCREIEAYPSDDAVWAQPPGIANSAGTLALHLAGNIQHFVGGMLGRSGYTRDRPREFTLRDRPRAEILAELRAAMRAVETGFQNVGDEHFTAPFPELIAGRSIATGAWLMHLLSHLAYHLGQVDYHRRIVTGNPAGVDAVAVKEVAGL